MIIAIIAGGSGTRLWPLSQTDYPKHLLRLTGKTSLLQNTYQRAKAASDNIWVVTDSSHAEAVKDQLPDLPADQVIIEPARRGTASCIVLALAHIAQKHADETVVFIHADHHVPDESDFATTITRASQASEQHDTIALIGLQPTYPATGFGYIKTGKTLDQDQNLPTLQVEAFVEKPNLGTAEQYLADGDYLWNMGLFAASPQRFAMAFKRFAPDLATAYQVIGDNLNDPAQLKDSYLALVSQPIDTALIEKVKGLVVIPGSFEWADIGSFLDLHKILKGINNNALKGEVEQEDCEDCLIHANDKPIVAIGLRDMVVIDSPEGILVCAKDKTQLVGEVSKRLAQKAKDASR